LPTSIVSSSGCWSVSATTAISGASFRRSTSVRQSKDCTVVRDSMPAARIASISATANTSGDTLDSGSSGSILVSTLKRTSRLPACSTSAKTSERRGMRSPSTGFCSGNCTAYALPGLMRPTSYCASSA
jgi:hypothetical protein